MAHRNNRDAVGICSEWRFESCITRIGDFRFNLVEVRILEISSSNQTQIAAFQRTQSSRLQTDNTQASSQRSSQAANQNSNSTVQISNEARQLFANEQVNASTESSLLGSGGSQSGKPK